MSGLISVFKLLATLVCNPLGLIIIAVIVLKGLINYYEYKKSTYYLDTHNSYLSVYFDKGKYGEYLTYKYLRKYEKNGAKFLFNAYIPKGNEGTTEIDVLMLCTKGIFVFESKNYSGWIFGKENQKNWYQTIRLGRGKSRKEHFYNPIMQNRTHIKHLGNLVGENIPMKSIIAFSNRCTLKRIEVNSNDVYVINRRYVNSVVKEIYNQDCEQPLNNEQIYEIYNKIYPYTQVSESIKKQHITNIQERNMGVETVGVIGTVENDIVTNTKTVDDVMNEVENMKCPRCGNELLLRAAKRGANAGKQFYGCSNYPKCKYIKDIT